MFASCTPGPTDQATSQTDVDRAAKVWNDPWIAPDNLVAPSSAYGSNGFVTRLAGKRTTTYAANERQAGLIEVRAARQHGWKLRGANCTEDGILVELTRGSGLNDGALARVEVRAQRRLSEVEVSGLVPHHADGSWPDDKTVIKPTETCLRGGTQTLTPLIDQGEPLSGSGAEDPRDDLPDWAREKTSEAEDALVDEIEADPWFSSNNGQLSDPQLHDGDNSRFGPTSRVTVPRSEITVGENAAATIEEMESWQLTWVSCVGSTLTATLRLRVRNGTAVARLQVSPAEPRDVTVDVTLPAAETPPVGPAASAPVLARSGCLEGSTPRKQLTVEGEPIAVPNNVQPLPMPE